MTLTFLGAARQVTGSCYLLDTGQRRVLLDCGLFQGPPEVEAQNDAAFGFEPARIDAVVLSHAHLDHSGLLPRLVHEGFDGPIFVTAPTRDLLGIMLKDAAFIMQKDIEWENRKRQRAGKRPRAAGYTLEDVETVIARCRPMSYGKGFAVADGVEARFHDAGHIIGSAIVDLHVGSGGQRRRLVFSGDLGNRDTPILPPPAILDGADVLLLESTYGDRDHRPMAATLEEFESILRAADESGGNVLIPAFAVGRTQELLYRLGELHHAGRLPQQKVFLDSPMAIAATEVHQQHLALFDPKARAAIEAHGGDARSFLPPLTLTRTPEESMGINRVAGGAVIIAGSGMCSGGRIRHHLKYNLWRREAHVIMVGFQAQGTPGRALVDGAESLNILGDEVAVKATVHTLGGFSAHAGRRGLLAWAAHLATPRPRLHLVHGEPAAMAALQKAFHDEQGWEAKIPGPGERIEL
ncbi:MAG TPA: MBL fold metallo-hydrolase [Acidiferrobacterales bacterium]